MNNGKILVNPADIALFTLTLKFWIANAPAINANERAAMKRAKHLYHMFSALLEVSGYPSLRTV